jgi:hypothetical protein
MAMARILLVVPRMACAPHRPIRFRRRPAAVWRRILTEFAALPDHGAVATLDNPPPEFFRFPPF